MGDGAEQPSQPQGSQAEAGREKEKTMNKVYTKDGVMITRYAAGFRGYVYGGWAVVVYPVGWDFEVLAAGLSTKREAAEYVRLLRIGRAAG